MKLEAVSGLDELPALAREFLTHLIGERNLSMSTAREYAYDLATFFSFLRERRELKKPVREMDLEDMRAVDRHDLRDFVFHLATVRYNNPGSRVRKLSAVSSFFNYLVREECVPENPVRHVQRPKMEKRYPVYLYPEEARGLLETVSDEEGLSPRQVAYHRKLWKRDYAILSLLLYSGVRIGELVRLKVDDINLATSTMRVSGKGGKERMIALHPEAGAAIEGYLACRPARRDGADLNFLFLSLEGYPLSKRAAQETVKQYVLRAGLRSDISAHKLRHTFATALLAGEVDLITISELLGHASVATTQVYAHTNIQRRKDAIDKLDY